MEDKIVPSHVPPDLVFDFDFHNDPRLAGDPQGGLRALLALPPIFYTPRNGGHWIVSGYDTVYKALHEFETFSSVDQQIPRSDVQQFKMIPVMMDPPEHTKYRHLISPLLSPKAVGPLEDNTRRLARSLIDGFIDKGRCEFVNEFAAAVPVTIFLRLMGLPIDRLIEFRTWTADFFNASSEETLRNANDKIMSYLTEVILARQGSDEDDFISTLWRQTVDDRSVTADELVAIAMLLFVAGTATVADTIAFAMRSIAGQAELQRKIAAQPSAISEVVEEALRLFAAANVQRRINRDTVFEGVPMRKNDVAVLMTSSAGSDERISANAGDFELGRPHKHHLGFGAGPHRCAGSHLARIELRVCFEEWFARIPSFRVAPGASIKTRAGTVLAMDSLPLEWD